MVWSCVTSSLTTWKFLALELPHDLVVDEALGQLLGELLGHLLELGLGVPLAGGTDLSTGRGRPARRGSDIAFGSGRSAGRWPGLWAGPRFRPARPPRSGRRLFSFASCWGSPARSSWTAKPRAAAAPATAAVIAGQLPMMTGARINTVLIYLLSLPDWFRSPVSGDAHPLLSRPLPGWRRTGPARGPLAQARRCPPSWSWTGARSAAGWSAGARSSARLLS